MHPYFNHIQLGYLGFVPFLLCIAATLMLGSSESLVGVFSFYSMGILAFMAGTMWRAGEQPKAHAILAVVVVLPFPLLYLVSFTAQLSYLAASYWLVLWFEKSMPKWQETHKDYKQMRFVITSVVFVSHLFMISQAIELTR
ncbi:MULTISPECIES: DUF3429 domain-containing protein [Pseudoalteromonas]|uniref:DUF3429 domain-containing protein n=1 Tax=Pseudoalteromonas luteoviolacea (strain 2ta16) TaxID=1353533 RepID=V4I3A7_PSEL2|nr:MULTISPECIES: DUF3429 domain-containing protein [Pseudoalteromonas]ESP94719.1 protein of unknown function (DUF3429) [Pseudoalteromonas luteoviolacea 2ta16]KZN43417.1 hypothetical protein N483_08975 [Pseudoalteromonas luteoviolacea NCIMB 1944]MCG7547452.1 DUF3429 domain-containing protein [Pseudoalteromonas sp. Of7M-16]